MDALIIENVTKVYENVTAVEQVNLNIAKGSIFGLLGPNGAGKTTLIRMITGILEQDTGNIILSDTPANNHRSLHIGYMPEERGLYKKMKVGEQILYLAQLKNLSAKQAREQMNEWFERLSISGWLRKEVGELSKGMQQKVQFIATVIHRPKLIILDEPFTGLDPINANIIKDEIYNLSRQGATILFSTHRMEQVEEICDSIALINKGQILLNGQMKTIKEQFKEHLYSVSYTGELPELMPQTYQIRSQANAELIIQLQKNEPATRVLTEMLAQGLSINGFREILPSLNQIFITCIEKNNTANNVQ